MLQTLRVCSSSFWLSFRLCNAFWIRTYCTEKHSIAKILSSVDNVAQVFKLSAGSHHSPSQMRSFIGEAKHASFGGVCSELCVGSRIMQKWWTFIDAKAKQRKQIILPQGVEGLLVSASKKVLPTFRIVGPLFFTELQATRVPPASVQPSCAGLSSLFLAQVTKPNFINLVPYSTIIQAKLWIGPSCHMNIFFCFTRIIFDRNRFCWSYWGCRKEFDVSFVPFCMLSWEHRQD